MGQKLYVLENTRLTQAYVRRDLLKVDPPNEAEAASRAEEDARTNAGRPVDPRSARQVGIRAKAKEKQRQNQKQDPGEADCKMAEKQSLLKRGNCDNHVLLMGSMIPCM